MKYEAFRIEEKRGEFRIMAQVSSSELKEYSSSMEIENLGWFKPSIEKHTICKLPSLEWRELLRDFDSGEPSIGVDPLWVACGYKDNSVGLLFPAYKQAENYIKKHFGLEGVKAIEEPEWRVV